MARPTPISDHLARQGLASFVDDLASSWPPRPVQNRLIVRHEVARVE
jgi:hypothetical protein